MRRLLPKSLNGFLLLGLGAIAAPLLIAILQATFQMRQLTAASQRLVLESVQLTGLSQDLYEQIASLERSARLYQVLRDGTVFAAYRSNDEKLANTIRVLHSRMNAPEAGARLDALSAGEQSIRDMVRDSAAPTATPAEFPDLADRVEPIVALIEQQINAGRAALQERTDLAQRELLWESTLLLPIFAIAILAVTLGLGRPLRQIDRAIGELGVGNFSRAIAVRGPVDVERLGRQLEWLRTRLVDLAHERNRFLRHMSHELKTPLANIREGTELLMDGAVGELEPAQREVTTILQENSIKLQRMIENLLSFSAWQSNSAGVDPSEFRVRLLVKQVLENQQLTLVSQRVRLDVQVEDVTLYADRGKIRLILENLLSNAIKYTPRGGAIFVRAGSNADQFVLEVADTGIGIPPADRPNIFDAFYTGRAPGGHIKGTGIGLSVVNEFVHVHNGTIAIVDGEFSGAHFKICMPLRLTTPVEPPSPERRNGVSERRNANAA